MQEVYSPFRRQGRPNTIIDLMGSIRPQLELLGEHFSKGEYGIVISIYERLRSEYTDFETDLGKIAFAYYRTGDLRKAETYIIHLMDAGIADDDDILTYIRILQQEGRNERVLQLGELLLELYQRAEGALVRAEIFKQRGDTLQELHAWYTLLRQEGLSRSLRIRAFSEVARLHVGEAADEAEYFMWMALQDIGQQEIETVEFARALSFIHTFASALASPRVKAQLGTLNLQFRHSIHRIHSELYEKIMNIPSVDVMLLDMTDELIEKGLSTLDEFRKDIEQKGDYILRSLNEHFTTEQPTLAYAKA
jgi:tetratricopeptide (TPR) repeat protein